MTCEFARQYFKEPLMACQIFQWLIAGTDRSTLEHASIGIGLLLVVDQAVRWRKRRTTAEQIVDDECSSIEPQATSQQRRAA